MKMRARTIRLRLTLIYGGAFLIGGAALLTVGYLLVRHNLYLRHPLHQEATRLGGGYSGQPPHAYNVNNPSPTFEDWYNILATRALHRLVLEFIGALMLMTAASVAAGWWMAGRALAPLRAITATARRVSGENLGERIDLEGPEDELKELADTFDGMLTRLDSAFASQRHFVANASHELRTEVDVALADPDASVEELRTMAETVRETIDRSEGLIAALLTLARSETISGREEPVDLCALAGDCVTDFSRRAVDADVEIESDLEPAITHGESGLLERLIGNLVDNGIRHNRPGGTLSIGTRTIGSLTEILVRNTGAVIEPEDAKTLTEPFRRLSRKPGGFGLGLSIVRSVVDAHQGTLAVTPLPEGGLEVRVLLAADSGDRQAPGSRRLRALTKT